MLIRAAALVLVATLASCCVVKSAKKKVEKALDVADCVEKIAEGDTSQIRPLVMQVLGGAEYLRVVHEEEGALVAEVRRIPGLGLKIPTSETKRYYLRIDLKTIEKATKMVVTFFKGAKGVFDKLEKADDIISKGASELFGAIFAALLKAGVFLK